MTDHERQASINAKLLMEFHQGIFEYTDLPETILPSYLEEFLQMEGKTAIFRIPEGKSSPGFESGSLICTSCTLGTNLTPYGEGSEVIAVTRNGWEYRADRYSQDIVVGFNNKVRDKCPDIINDSNILTEIDISLKFLIFWTRLAPLIKVADEKEKQKIETAFKNIVAGIPVTYVGGVQLPDLGIGSDLTVEQLTQPDFADKIQYTAKLREDILRWHYTRYGQVVQGDTKLAQQSVDEVNGTVSSSLVLVLNMLEARREMVEEINSKFGTSIKVDLAGPWRAQVTKYETNTGEGDIDGSEPEATEPEAPDQEQTETEVEDNDRAANTESV